MELNENLTNESNIEQLSNEMTYRRYAMSKVNVKKFFYDLSITDYIIMSIAAGLHQKNKQSPNRIYLEDLAQKLQLPIYKVSKIVGNLRDRGLLLWSHDGDGSDGTYIIITETGRKTVEKQAQVLKNFYGKVIEKFGKEKFIRFLHMMNKLDEIMQEEIQELEGGCADD